MPKTDWGEFNSFIIQAPSLTYFLVVMLGVADGNLNYGPLFSK